MKHRKRNERWRNKQRKEKKKGMKEEKREKVRISNRNEVRSRIETNER